MLPNLGALARGDAATGGPVSQGSQPPPASQAPRPNDEAGAPKPPHAAHSIEGVVRAVLAQLGDADDPEAACATVESFCATDRFHNWACYPGDPTDPQNPWRVITKRVFKSTDVDKALFAHDELLKTDPKKAFKRACFDRAAARVVGLRFLPYALRGVKETLYDNQQTYDVEDGDFDVEASDVDAMADFEQRACPITAKFSEWEMVADQKYEKSDDKFKIFDTWTSHGREEAQSLGFLQGRGWPQTSWHAHGWKVLKDMSVWPPDGAFVLAPRREDEDWSSFFGRADDAVHALAERVGRATVWVWRKADGGHIEITDEHTRIAEKCVRVFPAMEFSNE